MRFISGCGYLSLYTPPFITPPFVPFQLVSGGPGFSRPRHSDFWIVDFSELWWSTSSTFGVLQKQVWSNSGQFLLYMFHLHQAPARPQEVPRRAPGRWSPRPEGLAAAPALTRIFVNFADFFCKFCKVSQHFVNFGKTAQNFAEIMPSKIRTNKSRKHRK